MTEQTTAKPYRCPGCGDFITGEGPAMQYERGRWHQTCLAFIGGSDAVQVIRILRAENEALRARVAELEARRNGVYFVADSSFHGWTHEATGRVWDTPQDAAHDYIVFCNKRDDDERRGLAAASAALGEDE